MIYYPQYKVCFKGHTKCAQTSLYVHFGSPWSGTGIFGEGLDSGNDVLSEMKKELPDYKFITFIRNPFDRIVSAYYYYKEKGKTDGDPNFDTFESWVMSNSRGESYGMLALMTEFINIKTDFLGRFETLTKDVKKLQKDFNTPKTKLPWRNKSNKRKVPSYREMYTPAMRDFIETHYKEDLDRFNYEF